jgi:hypothetical protein
LKGREEETNIGDVNVKRKEWVTKTGFYFILSFSFYIFLQQVMETMRLLKSWESEWLYSPLLHTEFIMRCVFLSLALIFV